MMCQPSANADGDIRSLKSLRTLRQRAAVIPAARKSKITLPDLRLGSSTIFRDFKVVKGLKETIPADLTAAVDVPARPYSRRHSVAG